MWGRLMRKGEFCSVCKHHYFFHDDGQDQCRMLYPPRYVNLDKEIAEMAKVERVYYSEVNFCKCKEFV